MRDILLLTIVFVGCVAALKRPWIGVMLWTWLSIMNPHRYTYGIAYSAPLAAITVGCTLLGLLMTNERESPFKGSPVKWFVAFVFWVNVSWLAGLDFSGDYEQWKKVMKIDIMILVAFVLLHSKQHIFAMVWVCTASIGLLGVKGGIFTILGGGSQRVWGPPGSFIEDNNAFAVATVMVIPLLRFLQLQIPGQKGRLALTLGMLLCAASALGSQSRGALLAIIAMSAILWWRSKDKVRMGILLLIVAMSLAAFMPDTWSTRMASINTYEQDGSAMGRVSAWWAAWNIAFHYPVGVGFNTATSELFARFSPYPDLVQGPHSIYFQVLGSHGFVGLILFVGIWVSTWRSASWLRNKTNDDPETKWCKDLGTMCQVALAGYAVGGAFLTLAYFDLPYNIMLVVVLTRAWVEKKGWKSEPIETPRWKMALGLSPTPKLN